jgi:hypothetical protein
MPTIGLVVEGIYDEAAIPALVKRCHNRATVITRKCKGSVTGRLVGIVTELERSCKPERVLVISDADGERPDTLIDSIRTRVAGRYPFPVTPIVIVQMLEAWLLVDPTALNRVAGIKRSFPRPERIRNPKRELQRLFGGRAAYTPEVALRLAQQVDLELLANRCPQFYALRKALVHP